MVRVFQLVLCTEAIASVLCLQSVPCEGAIDSWLSTFVQQLQTSLQKQVATALAAQQSGSTATLNTAEEAGPGTPSKCMYKLIYFNIYISC